MASFSRTIAQTHLHNPASLHFSTSCTFSLPSSFCFSVSFPSSLGNHRSSPILLHRPFSAFPTIPNRSNRRCRAGSAGPPSSPPERPDPGPGNQPVRSNGMTVSLSRIWDSIHIFFAVLFWMALFFWASVWDGKNTGRRNRGNRFRR